MSQPACERCGLPRPKGAERYCSLRCYHAASLRQRAICCRCKREYPPLVAQQRFCSVQCSETPHWPWQSVLEILRGNTGWYMTVSDLSIWMYGDDRPCDQHAIQMILSRLRRWGYRIESRRAVWVSPSSRRTVAYRLIEAAQERVA